MLAAARAELQEQADVLTEQLEETLAGLPITIEDDPNADVEEVRVSNVNLQIDEFELIEVRGGKALVSGPATVSIEVDATVADYDNGSRDEGDWVFLPYNSVTYVDEFEVRMSVRIPFGDAPLTMQQMGEVIVDEPRSMEFSSYDTEVRTRKHWTEDDEPEGDEEAVPPATPAPGTPPPPTRNDQNPA